MANVATTRAVAKKEEAAVDEWRSIEWESDGTEEIAPSFPVIKIVQPTSSMEGSGKKGGEFWRSDNEEYYPTLDVVALFSKTTRAYFEEAADQPACASNDGIAPRPNQPLWEGKEQPRACASCPFSEWGEDGTPPRCKESLAVLVDHDGELAQLRIGGKSMKPFKNFVARKLKPKKLPLCSQRLHLYTEEKTEPQKKWFELRIDAEQLKPTDASVYNAVLAYERGRFMEAASGDEPEIHDVTPGGDGWGDGSQSYAASDVPEL